MAIITVTDANYNKSTLNNTIKYLDKITGTDIFKAILLDSQDPKLSLGERRRIETMLNDPVNRSLLDRPIKYNTRFIVYIGPGFYAVFGIDGQIYDQFPISPFGEVEWIWKMSPGVYWNLHHKSLYGVKINESPVKKSHFADFRPPISVNDILALMSWRTLGNGEAVIISNSWYNRHRNVGRALIRAKIAADRSLSFLPSALWNWVKSLTIDAVADIIYNTLLYRVIELVPHVREANAIISAGQSAIRFGIAGGMAAWGTEEEDINISARLIAAELVGLFISGLLERAIKVVRKVALETARVPGHSNGQEKLRNNLKQQEMVQDPKSTDPARSRSVGPESRSVGPESRSVKNRTIDEPAKSKNNTSLPAMAPSKKAAALEARKVFTKVYKELEAAGWKKTGPNRSIFPDEHRYPTVEIRPNGDVLGSYKDVIKYVSETGLAARRRQGESSIEVHHLLEDRLMEQFGTTKESGRSVALEEEDHSIFSKDLPNYLPHKQFFDIDDIFDAHKNMYLSHGHPEWISEMGKFLSQNKNLIRSRYEQGLVPGAKLPDYLQRKKRVLRFLDSF